MQAYNVHFSIQMSHDFGKQASKSFSWLIEMNEKANTFWQKRKIALSLVLQKGNTYVVMNTDIWYLVIKAPPFDFFIFCTFPWTCLYISKQINSKNPRKLQTLTNWLTESYFYAHWKCSHSLVTNKHERRIELIPSCCEQPWPW